MEYKREKLTEDGEAFLKTTTSAPDFEDLEFNGIPDNHSGPTVVVRQYVTQTLTAFVGRATYFIFTPQPDVALWETSSGTGSDWINGQDIVATMFPKAGDIFSQATTYPTAPNAKGGSNSRQISALRMVTSSMELNCLNNAFNQYGSITAWKVPLKALVQSESPAPTSVNTQELVINGIEGIRSRVIGSTSYARPVRDGVYAITMNREDEFDFVPVRDSESKASVHPAYYDTPASSGNGVRALFNGPMCAFDNNFDTIVVRVDVPVDTTPQSFLVKRWVSFEAEPVFNSLLWDTAHQSPKLDRTALDLYSEISRGLPVAVRDKDNPDFWDTVLNVVGEVSDVLSYLPGPIGTGAKGAHAIATALQKPKRGNKKNKGKMLKTKKYKVKK
jgi:hypothetical protein